MKCSLSHISWYCKVRLIGILTVLIIGSPCSALGVWPQRRVTVSPTSGWEVYLRENGASDWGNTTQDFSNGVWGIFNSDTFYLADLNGDGIDDRILVRADSNSSGYYMRCKYSTKTGFFDASLPEVSAVALGGCDRSKDSLLFGDLNGDHCADVIRVSHKDVDNPMTWSARLSQGIAGFPTDLTWHYSASFGNPVTDTPLLGDINGDGYVDRILVRRVNPNTVSVYVNYSVTNGFGDGTFNTSRTLSSCSVTDRICLSDINGDGKDDLVIVRNCGTYWQLDGFYTDGSGRFRDSSDPGITTKINDVNTTVLFGKLDGAAWKTKYDWLRDLSTGNMIAQLTTDVGPNNYAFYWHQNCITPHGKYLVYRNISNNFITYFRLNLDTGENQAIVPAGLANCVFVSGNWMYAFISNKIGGLGTPYKKLSRFNLETLIREDLHLVSGTLSGSMAISCDDSSIIYAELEAGGSKVIIHRYNLTTKQDSTLFAHDTTLAHLQFSQKDPNRYMYYNQGAGRPDLKRLSMGKLDLNTHSSFTSADPYLNSVKNFPHAFFASDGWLWCDTLMLKNGQYDANSYIRFAINDTNNGASISKKIPIDNIEWQIHTTPTRCAEWFAGDGKGADPTVMGEPYIHLLNLDTNSLTSTQYRLAEGKGTTWDHWCSGDNHVLPTQDRVIFSTHRNLADESNVPTNVFMVHIPNNLKTKLRDKTISGLGPGPFKHGNRIRVDSSGVWYCDYGNTASFGDGNTDQSANGFGDCLAAAFDMADINGDGVEDRIAMKWTADDGGTWTVYLNCSNYGGAFGNVIEATAAYSGFDANMPPRFADLNGDGYDDVVTTVKSGDNLLWYGRSNIAGTLSTGSPSIGYNGVGFGDAAIDLFQYVADVNGDGYADRIVIRKYSDGWQWICNYSTSGGFDTAPTADSAFIGGDNTIDTPMVDDIDGDGYADILIARRQNNMIKWYANLSSSNGFGNKWGWGPETYGNSGDKAMLVGHLTHVTTLAAPRIKAGNPSPGSGATRQSLRVALNWAPSAIDHDVYLGTNFSVVTNATISSPEYMARVWKTGYTTATLNSGTKYYWRIDAVNSNGILKGDVWNFTTEIIGN